MKKLTIITLIAALLLIPDTALARKKKKKYEKSEVQIEQPQVIDETPQPVVITNPTRQLYGEWDLETMRKKSVSTRERAYLYLDFKNHKVYGNNGCNDLNGRFQLHGTSISFLDMITTDQSCHSATSERTVMKTLSEVRSYKVTQLYGMEYLHLLNNKGNELMTLKRQNLDMLGGVWLVKEVDNTTVTEKNMRLVIDPVMQTLHGRTDCNIINGIITIDTEKDFAIQFEDLHSSEQRCDDMAAETSLLLALERAEYCKRINDQEVALLDGQGTIVLRLTRTTLDR
ncbi:MAG: META domain-containing protein [Muribaculaceae bacterium]|nr:META domain-containing protein [Muribaculaceae bacterium]MBR1475145.1 META domain-containing protein [Muribaculaceae bacterium]